MRSKREYLRYFKLENPSLLFFGVSHFFNRARTVTGWKSYHEVLRHDNGGRLLLGQLPSNGFNAELLAELSPGGLIVACNEYFELAGCGTVFSVTNPSLWHDAGIEHFHLPFTDFSANAEPQLIFAALAKMLEVYSKGETVYVHCKAGRSRSALISAIFMCVLELRDEDPNNDEENLKQLLLKKIEQLKSQRQQVEVDEEKINLGVNVLRQYLTKERDIEVVEVYTQSEMFFAKLTQAPQFKALWHYAYNQPDNFGDMQVLLNALYEDPLEVLQALNPAREGLNRPLNLACKRIKENQAGVRVLKRLQSFLFQYQAPEYQSEPTDLQLSYQNFNRVLEQYKEEPHIKKIARQLHSSIFLSSEPTKDKISWLEKTCQFLADPTSMASSYYAEAENAVLSDDPTRRKFGKGMLLLGAVVLMATLFIGAFIVSTYTLPVVLSISCAALLFMALGKWTMNSAVDNKVTEHSRGLVKHFSDEPESRCII